MRLILASEGFATAEIVAECVALVGKPAGEINVAVINEAYAVEPGDHRWVLSNLNAVAGAFGGKLELVNLLALDPGTISARLSAADVLFVVGGNTDYLMSVLISAGVAGLLPKLLRDKVYVGSSAGSMILGPRLPSAATAAIYAEGGADYQISQYLGLVGFAVLPHLGNEHYPRNTAQQIPALLHGYSGPVYAITDNSAVIVNGDACYIVGDQPVTINGVVGHADA